MSFDGTNPSSQASFSTPVQAPALEPTKQAPSPPAPTPDPDPPQIEDFDAIIQTDVQAFVNIGQKIGGLVGEQVFIPEL